jgi:hypothetical protein
MEFLSLGRRLAVRRGFPVRPVSGRDPETADEVEASGRTRLLQSCAYQPDNLQMRVVKITPCWKTLVMPACASGSLDFGYLFVCCGGLAFAIALFIGDTFDWFFGVVLLPFGVVLMWKSLRDFLDRRHLVLLIVRVALFGTLLGAAASPSVGGER